MQMEAETADLLDRRMMQLYAVANKNMTKQDVHNASSNLKKPAFGARLQSQIETTGIPELGLEAINQTARRGSLPTVKSPRYEEDDDMDPVQEA